MKVRQVEAVAFGPFAGETLELGPRMNVIFGPNEAGKSSWHAAIYAGICGRRRARGAGTKADREFAEDHKPWNGNGWEVRIVLDLEDGRTVELHQVLDDPASSRVVDADTGRDITGEFLSDGAPDASRKLGLSRATMFATATVRQAEIRRVHGKSEALQRQLQAATTVAGADRTAQAAIERIKQFSSENVGLRRANATKPLQTAINEVGESEEALREARSAHEGYLDLRQGREEAEAECTERERELVAAQQTLDRLKLEKLRDRMARAQKLAGDLPEGEQPDLEVLQQGVESIRQIVTRFEERPEEQEVPEGSSAVALQRELAELPEMPVGDLEPSDEVESAREGWRSAREAAQAHQKYRPQAAAEAEEVAAGGAELRRLATALEASAPQPDRQAESELEALYGRRRTPFWKLGARAVGVVLPVVAAGLAATGLATPWWIGTVVVGLLALGVGFLPQADRERIDRGIRGLEAELAAQGVRRKGTDEERRAAEGRLAELDLPADPEHLRAVAQRQEVAATTRKEIEDWEGERQRLREARSACEQELKAAIAGRMDAGDEEAADLEAMYRRYAQQCGERARLAREAEKAGGLGEQLGARKALEERIGAAAVKRAAAEAAVVELAEGFSIGTEDVEAAVAELQSQAAAQAASYKRWHQALADAAKLEELLAGKTVSQLEEDVEELAVDFAQGPNDLDPVDLGDDPEAALEAIRARRNEARGRSDRLIGQIENQEHDLESVAEAQEALEQAEAKLDRVERLERTLQTTRTFLEEARESVQRDLAPHLRQVLETSLEVVTGGRYKEARVDPANLEVTVRAANGEWHSADRLSHGTMEQIYLLLRVALVRHLCSAGEPSPIFLDDPTVQSDTGRTIAILDVLEQLSEDHQIILFSQEEEVRQWAQARQGSAAVNFIEIVAGKSGTAYLFSQPPSPGDTMPPI